MGLRGEASLKMRTEGIKSSADFVKECQARSAIVVYMVLTPSGYPMFPWNKPKSSKTTEP
jgi:hypothetical protein